MKVLVLGATGKIGRSVIEQGLSRGHEMTAFARSTEKLRNFDWYQSERLRCVDGDIDSSTLAEVVADQDAVIWTIGAALTRANIFQVPDVCQLGTRNVIEAMQQANVRRFVCLSSIGVGDSRKSGRFVFRYSIRPLLLGRILTDRERQEDAIRQSADLDWTIFRPSELTDRLIDKPLRAMLAPYGPATWVQRNQVARFLVETAGDTTSIGRTYLLSQ